MSEKCLVKAVTLWDTADFHAEAEKQFQIIMAAVGFRVNTFALNEADRSPLPQQFTSPSPAAHSQHVHGEKQSPTG